jgi:hypothetical protein
MIEEIDFNDFPHMPYSHKAIVRELFAIANDEGESPKIRGFMAAMLRYMLDDNADYEMIIRAASEMGYRLSEFPGDMIGRAPDDYSDYEESA